MVEVVPWADLHAESVFAVRLAVGVAVVALLEGSLRIAALRMGVDFRDKVAGVDAVETAYLVDLVASVAASVPVDLFHLPMAVAVSRVVALACVRGLTMRGSFSVDRLTRMSWVPRSPKTLLVRQCVPSWPVLLVLVPACLWFVPLLGCVLLHGLGCRRGRVLPPLAVSPDCVVTAVLGFVESLVRACRC